MDEFKSINDWFGHDVGDEVLKEIGRRLRDACRAGDAVARIGAEEFGLILTRTSVEGAGAVGERTRALVSDRGIASSAGVLRVTVSVGLAGAGGEVGFDATGLYRAADEALYASKRAGRNRVTVRCSRAAKRPPNPPQ